MWKIVIAIVVIIIIGFMIYFAYDPYRAVEWWNPIVDYLAKDRDVTEMMNDLWNKKELILWEFRSKRDEKLFPVGEINKYERYLAGDDQKWKMLPIRYLTDWRNEKDMPLTTSFLKPYESIIGNAYISVLEPQKVIPTHRGPYTGVQRVHIPLYVPEGDLGLETRHGIHRWTRPFYFKDADLHRAWNLTDDERIVLIFDVFRQLPPVAQQLHDLFISMSTIYARGLK